MELTVVIPTFNRRRVLEETLKRLAEQRVSYPYEVIVIDDGSTDGSADAARSIAAGSPIPIRILQQPNSGPAAARNRGIATADGKILLFLGDDMWPRPDLVGRHVAFHRANPEPEVALLGQVVWALEAHASPLMEWLNSAGIQFAYQFIEDAKAVPPTFFYTSNVSVKAALVRSQGGFDEAFPDAALEDTEFGLRLGAAGMRLVYEPDAIAEHYHPVDLPGTLDRITKIGRSARLLVTRFPDWRGFPGWHTPPHRGLRTLAKEALLTGFHAAGVRPQRVRHATWWLLSQQSFQAAFFEGHEQMGGDWLGRRLRQLAKNDPATWTRALDAKRTGPDSSTDDSVEWFAD
jgi:glycosyltransferase involved in cell wall biosynthesis